MLCPLCFKDLGNDTIYLSPAGDPLKPLFIPLEPPNLPGKPRARLPVQEERLISHEGCDCLHPLVSFEGHEEEAARILNSGHRLDSQDLRACVTGVLDESEWGALTSSSNDHWSFVRIRYLAQTYSGLKSMWFPERLFPWLDEAESSLQIFVIGPRKVGKSVFSALAGSATSYAALGSEVRFQQNFGYARPRRTARPCEDYELLLKNLSAVKNNSVQIPATEKQSTFVIAAFFSAPLPGSEADTVTLYDVAGELHERDFSVRTHAIRSDRMYWCLVIPAEDLLAFRTPGAYADSAVDGVSSAVEKLLSAREDQRIVIVISKMDTVRWPTPANAAGRLSSAQMAAVTGIRQLIHQEPSILPAQTDQETRRLAHEAYGRHSTDLLRDLLSSTDSREQTLRRHLTTNSSGASPAENSRIRAVFFTGAYGWERPAQPVRPFGIGQAICWMAEDLAEAGRRQPGLLSRLGSALRKRRPSGSSVVGPA